MSNAVPKENRSIKVNGIYIKGSVNITQGDLVGGNQLKTVINNENWFSPIYQAVSKRPNTSAQKREILRNNIKEIETEIQKGANADKKFIFQRVETLKKMAPDILEIVLATLANPVGGISLVVTKLAKKVSEDAQNKK